MSEPNTPTTGSSTMANATAAVTTAQTALMRIANPSWIEPVSTPPIPRNRLGVHRSFHRRKQDQLSHADGQTHSPPAPLDHPAVPGCLPEPITSQTQLNHVLDTIGQAGAFAFDTEFIGETNFYPRLCLIQIATQDQLWLIDALADDIDLTGFWQLVADPSVLKILHAAAQDLEPVPRLTGGLGPANIFDTQVAAGFLGLAYPASMIKLCEELTSVKLDAGAKFTQWDRRPLSPMQRHYAANDVRYLFLMHQHLTQRLKEAGRLAWAHEEMGIFDDPKQYLFEPQGQKIKGVRLSQLKKNQRQVLRYLVDWRAHAAQEQDVPTRVLLPDLCLGELAKGCPQNITGLNQIKGIPKPVKDAYSKQILKTIQHALQTPAPKEKSGPRFDLEEHGQALDTLWSGITKRCEQIQVAQALCVNKAEVTRLIVNPSLKIRLHRGWRQSIFADLFEDNKDD